MLLPVGQESCSYTYHPCWELIALTSAGTGTSHFTRPAVLYKNYLLITMRRLFCLNLKYQMSKLPMIRSPSNILSWVNSIILSESVIHITLRGVITNHNFHHTRNARHFTSAALDKEFGSVTLCQQRGNFYLNIDQNHYKIFITTRNGVAGR